VCINIQVPDCDFFLNKRDYPQLKFHLDGKSDEASSSASAASGPRDTAGTGTGAGVGVGTGTGTGTGVGTGAGAGTGAGTGVGTGAGAGHVVEPYGFIYDQDDRDPSKDVPLAEHAYGAYAPVLSFYTSSRFADIPFPSTEDWESATGEMFIGSMAPPAAAGPGLKPTPPNPRELYTESNFKKFERSWSEKRETAFFRGSATGGGTTVDTNQRLHLALLSHNWEHEAKANSTSLGSGYVPLLDAKIARWNFRDKKIAGKKMTFINTKQFPFTGGPENFTPIYEQSAFKYLIYAEGHCAACRYGFMMRLGSVILKVESSCVADQMW
jgi:hypothetical protein